MSREQKQLEYEDVEIRGRMDIEDIARRQIDRCNASCYEPDQTLFQSSVLALLDLLPYHKRIQVLARKGEYSEEVPVDVYDEYWCGHPLPSSKRTIKEKVTDFHILYRIVLDAFHESGLTWQTEPELVDRGKKIENIKTAPTPLFNKEKNHVKQ